VKLILKSFKKFNERERNSEGRGELIPPGISGL
jgi:hypothetical protein